MRRRDALQLAGSGLAMLAIPVATVAACFQKDPECLIAHPGGGGTRSPR